MFKLRMVSFARLFVPHYNCVCVCVYACVCTCVLCVCMRVCMRVCCVCVCVRVCCVCVWPSVFPHPSCVVVQRVANPKDLLLFYRKRVARRESMPTKAVHCIPLLRVVSFPFRSSCTHPSPSFIILLHIHAQTNTSESKRSKSVDRSRATRATRTVRMTQAASSSLPFFFVSSFCTH